MTSAVRSRLWWFDRAARTGIALAILISSIALMGWVFHIDGLKSVLPGLATMKVNTALGLLVGGISLWTIDSAIPRAPFYLVARVGAVILIAIGVTTLLQDILNLDLGIDQFFIRDHSQPPALHPGRMSPATAVCFATLGLAILTFKARRRRFALYAHWFALVPLFVATLALIGYVYGVSSLYQVKPYSSMAAHTAFCFALIALSLLAADSGHGITSIAGSDTAGGVVCRNLLPTIPFTLIALGWVSLQGQQLGLYDTQFGRSLVVTLSIAVCVFAITSTAFTLHQIDANRQSAEAEIISLNTGLERRVEERTQQLAELSDALSIANKSLEKLSLHDGLTGIANRRFFDVHLGSQVTIARRRRQVLALVLCDVDCFKNFNDFYGHQAGDECLKRVAEALRSVGGRPADMAARYGGEEFALILPDTGIAGALQIAEAARAAVAALAIPHANSVAGEIVSISGGVAVLHREYGMTAEQLITAADLSLFQAKYRGRNRIVSLEPPGVGAIPA